MSSGFLMLRRGSETLELLADPDAFALLTLIALRARRNSGGLNRHELAPGEAMIGDYRVCGLTERRYRTAKDKLAKWSLATFRATNKGTIATLCNSAVYDANVSPRDEQTDRPATGQRRTRDEQSDRPETTNNKDNKEKKEEEGRGHPPAASRCVPPTIEEVTAYADKAGLKSDPAQFLYYYSARGWKDGKTQLTDWEALFRVWDSREETMPRRQNDPHRCSKDGDGRCSGPGVHRYGDRESPWWLCDLHHDENQVRLAKQREAQVSGGVR